MKPALERLAEHALNQMIADPEFHTKVPEYAAIQNELDDRLKNRLEDLESQEKLRSQMADKRFEHDDIVSHQKFDVSLDIQRCTSCCKSRADTNSRMDSITRLMSSLMESLTESAF